MDGNQDNIFTTIFLQLPLQKVVRNVWLSLHNSLTQINLHIPIAMKRKSPKQEQENWQEFVRQAIAKALEEREELKSA